MGSNREGSRKVLHWIGWALLGLLVAVVAAPIFMQAEVNGWRRSPERRTMIKFKQICTALWMYSADNDNLLPHEFSSNQDLRSALVDYIKNEEGFETLNPAGGAIMPNSNFAGVNLETVQSPAITVLIFETERWDDGRKYYGFSMAM